MSPLAIARSTLESRPRLLAAAFTCTVLLAQAGTAAASGNCGVISGP